jgi:hypothetical protein
MTNEKQSILPDRAERYFSTSLLYIVADQVARDS